jgi:hypothetical protein
MTNKTPAIATKNNNKLAFLLTAKPTVPLCSKPIYSQRLFDPSAAVPYGCSYPVPASFNYRVRPIEE